MKATVNEKADDQREKGGNSYIHWYVQQTGYERAQDTPCRPDAELSWQPINSKGTCRLLQSRALDGRTLTRTHPRKPGNQSLLAEGRVRFRGAVPPPYTEGRLFHLVFELAGGCGESRSPTVESLTA